MAHEARRLKIPTPGHLQEVGLPLPDSDVGPTGECV